VKVAAVTYTDGLSGAGIAAKRVHRAVRAHGVDSRLLVLRKRSQDDDIEALGGAWARRANTARVRLVRWWLRRLGADPGAALSANVFRSGVAGRLAATDADVVHLHWIGDEMIGIEQVATIGKPLVWTLHDEWFSEGLAHYGAIEGVAAAPDAHGAVYRALDHRVRERKRRAWALARPLVVTPSAWLARRTVAAGLVDADRVRVVPNTIPLDVYRPQDRQAARASLGLPADARVVGFGAVRADVDPRKGYRLLMEALQVLRENEGGRDMHLLVFGANAGRDTLPLPAQFAGTVLDDARIAALYAAMDVFVCPSMQENLPNTIGEAMACGVPCAAFAVGGIPELIEPGRTGMLARPFDAGELAAGIRACIEQSAAYGAQARRFVEQRLAPEPVAAGYREAYADALRGG